MWNRRMAQIGVAAAIVIAPFTIAAVSPRPASPAAKQMASAARAFLGALDAEQKKLAQHRWDDADRQSMHFVPMVRSGVPLKRLDSKQRALAHALVRTGLSDQGYRKATQIMELETVLAELEKNPVRRDPELYYVWVFGDPAADAPWGWKFEGHHLSLNVTLVSGAVVVMTPTFFGANPAEVRSGPLKGRRALAQEEDRARELLSSFTGEARKKVIIDQDAPDDVLTAQISEPKPLDEEGVLGKDMSAKQKQMLSALLAEYAGRLPAETAKERLEKIQQAGLDKLRFAWAGGTKRGEPHYYRVTGPGFAVEYDNTQNGANHIHSVWRDFNNDFGRDLLREHLRDKHQVQGGKKQAAR